MRKGSAWVPAIGAILVLALCAPSVAWAQLDAPPTHLRG